MARHRRPRPVGRQLDLLRQPRQPLPPVRKLPRDRTAGIRLIAQHRALPQRVVGVLHRQRRQPRRHPIPPRPVELAQGRAAADAATSRRRQCDAAASSSTCSSPDSANRCARSGSSPRQIKAHGPPQPPAPPQAPPRSTAHNLKPRPRRPAASISCRGTPSRLREHRAKALVPSNQIAQRPRQRRAIELPVQPNRQRDHVGAAASPPDGSGTTAAAAHTTAASRPDARSRNQRRTPARTAADDSQRAQPRNARRLKQRTGSTARHQGSREPG